MLTTGFPCRAPKSIGVAYGEAAFNLDPSHGDIQAQRFLDVNAAIGAIARKDANPAGSP